MRGFVVRQPPREQVQIAIFNTALLPGLLGPVNKCLQILTPAVNQIHSGEQLEAFGLGLGNGRAQPFNFIRVAFELVRQQVVASQSHVTFGIAGFPRLLNQLKRFAVGELPGEMDVQVDQRDQRRLITFRKRFAQVTGAIGPLLRGFPFPRIHLAYPDSSSFTTLLRGLPVPIQRLLACFRCVLRTIKIPQLHLGVRQAKLRQLFQLRPGLLNVTFGSSLLSPLNVGQVAATRQHQSEQTGNARYSLHAPQLPQPSENRSTTFCRLGIRNWSTVTPMGRPIASIGSGSADSIDALITSTSPP